MARTPRNKPKSTGPGSGSPRSRTAARPGERATNQRSRTKPVKTPKEAVHEEPRPGPLAGMGTRAMGATWRLLILGVVVAVIAVTLAQSLRVYFAQADEIASLRTEIQFRRAQIEELETDIGRWDDPGFVEAEARERLGWVMPGETGFRVIGHDGEPIGGESNVLSADVDNSGAWYEQMWASVAVADEPLPAKDEKSEEDPEDEIIIGESPEPEPTSTE